VNVRELIEWLQTMPQEAEVEIIQHTSGRGYYDQGGNCSAEYFKTDNEYGYSDYWSLYDYKGVQHLTLGQMNV
jgi:hypothetical protein